jgi:hypothetical protein
MVDRPLGMSPAKASWTLVQPIIDKVNKYEYKYNYKLPVGSRG